MTTHRLRDINSVLLVVALILAVLLVVQIVRPTGSTDGVEEPAPGEPSVFPELSVARGGPRSEAVYGAIVERNLFSSEREPPAGRAKTMPRSEGEGTTSYEGLELIGTVVAGDEQSFALIRKGGVRGEIDSYRVQETVEGLELQDILYDRVVLSKNGKEIVLLLEPREEERKAIKPAATRMKERQKKPGPKQKKTGAQQGWTPKKRKGQ